MKKFRFISQGMAPQSRKSWLNAACKLLPHIFTEADIKPGMFSPSIEKRLRQAKKHGTKIILRRWRGRLEVGVVVVNKEDHVLTMKKKRAKIKALRKKLKRLLLVTDVQDFIKDIKVLGDVLQLGPHYHRNINVLLEQVK